MIPIEILRLPERTYNALLRYNIDSVQKIEQVGVENLIVFRGIGTAGIQAIKQSITNL